MSFELKDVLSAVGPAASLVFAAWIFLQLLNSRYVSSYDRYRTLTGEYREMQDDNWDDARRNSVREQILLYKKRCEQMRLALNMGLIAAMLVILGLITGAIQIAFTQLTFLKPVSLGCIVLGLGMVLPAAIIVLIENLEVKAALDSELEDIPDVKRAAQASR